MCFESSVEDCGPLVALDRASSPCYRLKQSGLICKPDSTVAQLPEQRTRPCRLPLDMSRLVSWTMYNIKSLVIPLSKLGIPVSLIQLLPLSIDTVLSPFLCDMLVD